MSEEGTKEKSANASPAETMEQSKKDTSGLATAGLVLGIVGMVAWVLPIIGFPVQIAGLVMSIKGRTSDKKKQATVGMVLCIIGLVLTVLNAAAGAYLGATGQLDYIAE